MSVPATETQVRSFALPPWPLLARLREKLPTAEASQYREALLQAQAELGERYYADEPIEDLVHLRAALVDTLVGMAWRHLLGEQGAAACLVAVGGYGRGELQPASDIDLLVLIADEPEAAMRAALERFVTFLWDIGLEVGHAVRTVDECVEQCRADVTVMTTLIEARLLEGRADLYEQLNRKLRPDNIWPVDEFFEAKVKEQAERHLRANDTAYNLEPNVKTGPGGLRDIQTIAWVAKRHFAAESLDDLAAQGFLTGAELRRLKQAQAFLWKVRFGLHLLAGRREDRLLFDNQIRLAKVFGYEDASFTLAVEQLMQRYYRTVMEVSLLNELLLQLFREAILSNDSPPQPVNSRFQLRNQYLEVVHDDVFARQPSAMLELFLILQSNPQIRGVRAATIRALTRDLWLIDEEFRQNPRHHRLFLEIMSAAVGVTHELRRMNRYGVLGRYIPAFGRIVGRMQYDLFHAYTVDAHTLFVVGNLRRLALSRYDQELPQVSAIMQKLPKPEIAYLAALFHDIAKGRGGDHSELGAVDAESFCLEQGMSRYDARMVAWLVRNHLQLSVTAQKQDISDPEVINAFARQVGDESHLDYLYVLTCADVRGTNPKLWNSWKESLFHEFYLRVRRALRRGLESPIDQEDLIAETQLAARQQLAAAALTPEQIDGAWRRLTTAYFLRHTPDEIAWHTRLLLADGNRDSAGFVAVRPETEIGTTSIVTLAPHSYDGFARTTAALDQLGLNIVDARITPTHDGFSIDAYHVLEADGSATGDPDRQREIQGALDRLLRSPHHAPPVVSRRAPRQARMFHTPTQVAISRDPRNRRSVVELIAGDRPGLLCDVGRVLVDQGMDLLAAKIMTVGERAEDVFFVTDQNAQPLDEAAAERLRTALIESLDRRRAA
ncbi:MAG: [protein-PII] uridylyltransferase [Steroidobacteraceae bacterium]